MRGEKMVVQYDSENDEYFVKERIGNQTVKLVFQMHDWNEDTIFFNVYLTLYNKRNQINSNEAEVKMTGENPFCSSGGYWALLHFAHPGVPSSGRLAQRL